MASLEDLPGLPRLIFGCDGNTWQSSPDSINLRTDHTATKFHYEHFDANIHTLEQLQSHGSQHSSSRFLRPNVMEFLHTHGVGGMLNISMGHTIDVTQRTWPEQTWYKHNSNTDNLSSARLFTNLERLHHLADADGFLSLLDTFLPYTLINHNEDLSDGDDAEIPNNPDLGYTEWQGVQAKNDYPIPAFCGRKPSPLASNIIFRWCDGVRSTLVEALKRNEAFQRRGKFSFDLTRGCIAQKNFLLGSGTFESYMKLWFENQADIAKKFGIRTIDESLPYLEPLHPEGEDTILDIQEYNSMDWRTLWPLDNLAPYTLSSTRLIRFQYNTDEEIKEQKNAWHKRRIENIQADDPKNYRLYKRFMKLNPHSIQSMSWDVHKECDRTGDDQAWQELTENDLYNEVQFFIAGEVWNVGREHPEWGQ